MVKALGQKSRDLGSSPSQCSPFPATKIALEKIIYLILSNLRNVVVNDDRSLMRMHMSNSSKEDIAHVYAHPIIFYVCSVHVQCQGHRSATS